VQAPTSTTEPTSPLFGRPQLFFFCELDGAALQGLLTGPQLLPLLIANSYGIALATRDLDDATAAAVRRLNQHDVPVVAWLLLAPAEGTWCNLQNYPQAVERYHAFATWARANGLAFNAIGLDIEPPASILEHLRRLGGRHIARRVRQAHENTLFTAARAAYTDLIAEIHHDGFEVHTYQLPILADDRRAGTSLAQRTLDIVDLPADVEVLMCYSSTPLEALDNDLGGALVGSYGPAADGIAVGAISARNARDAGDALPPLTWEAFERDLILAARHTDMIYVYSLEGCVERGLLPRIARINWDAEARVTLWKQICVSVARGLLLGGLLLTRFSRALFAWLGWGLFALLLARRLRAAIGRH
jgi:hypothetical protein